MPKELCRNQPILRFDVIVQQDWPIKQCLLHIGIFFGGKTRRPCFDLFVHNWPIKQITNAPPLTNTNQNHSSGSYKNHSISIFIIIIISQHLWHIKRNIQSYDNQPCEPFRINQYCDSCKECTNGRIPCSVIGWSSCNSFKGLSYNDHTL